MKKFLNFSLLVAFSISVSSIFAGPGDTTIVQTYTFEAQNNPNSAYDSPGRRWFDFPSSDNGLEYQKILMYHKLKCFEDGTAGNLGFPCGEWDYLAYNFLYQHTGLLDSNLAAHPLYLIENIDFDSKDLNGGPVYDIYQYIQSIASAITISESSYAIGDNDITLVGPFLNNPAQRLQYLYRADELLSAGLNAGDIDKLSLMFDGTNINAGQFQIRMKASNDPELDGFDQTGWTSVYNQDLDIATAGIFEFILNNSFSWDGSSNIIIDISYTDESLQSAISIEGQTTAYISSIHSEGNDRYIHFNWSDELQVPAALFDAVDEQITIAFWLNGDAQFQPMDGTVFEGRNAQNARVLNSHLPWSNSRVYWDAGSEGGFDRIDKAANPSDYEGQWNHWAFTKNVSTGEMKIFLNGVQWHSGINLDNPLTGIVEFALGSAVTWQNSYRGKIDEFAIYNTALTDIEIQNSMFSDLTVASNLLLYYNFNEANGEVIEDHSGNNFHGELLGNAGRNLHKGAELWRNGQLDYTRPYISFYQGEYDITLDEVVGEYEVLTAPVSVAEYVVSGNDIVLVDLDYAWTTGYSYTYNSLGNKIDSTIVETQYTLTNEDMSYYQAPYEVINRFELGRYITPYGIQLDLEDGWTWIYEVTDFAPLLRDSVELECGNWQELLDLQFLFIEGTPSREVKRVENFWVGNYGLSNMDQYVTDRSFDMEEGELGLKLKTVATGHGFGTGNNCAEFCFNTHSLQVNGFEEWAWEIMHDCADNALYPQGGTWIYARAGWCPGKEGKLEEFELTPFVENGTISVDYDIEFDPYGNYVFESQMITYGEMNHEVDVEIDQILSPSTFRLYSRENPMCDNPVIRIRNKGIDTITNCNINFGILNGNVDSFNWTGLLAFGEYEDVELVSTDPNLWMGNDEEELTFFAQLSYVNDLFIDNNPYNDYATSTFVRPPTYGYGEDEDDDNRIVVILKTNNAYWESEATLYDIAGNVVWHRDDYLAANTTYRDTLTINAGCYMFHLEDSGDDGLSFFANNDGNGSCRLDRVQGIDFEVFEADFGRDIKHYFYFDTDLVSVYENEVPKTTLSLYPNPVDEMCRIDYSGFGGKVKMEIRDIYGNLVRVSNLSNPKEGSSYVKVNDLSSGVYVLTVSDGTIQQTQRLIVK
ncbi:MAG: LamG-like jellyroll fold domain-containing protein [Flavobacteriales bacterium]|nr:LamG-like jellyroll fold domain-containing protein [Flavobacteriales bacterium]